MMLRARPTDPVLPLDAPPYCGTIYPLQKSTTLTCSRRRFPSARLCVRCAKCDGRPTAFAGLFFFSLFLSFTLLQAYFLCSHLRFSAIFLGFRPIFLSLSRFSSLFSPLDCPLSRFALLPLAPLPRTARDAAHTRAPHYQALGSRALHTWLATLTRSVRSYLLQGTVSRGPQAAAARSAHGLCSLVSRAHDSSQRRTERPTADRTLSAKKRVCFLSPSFLRLFFFSLFLPLFPFKFSPCALLSLFSPPPSFTPLSPPPSRVRARDTSS